MIKSTAATAAGNHGKKLTIQLKSKPSLPSTYFEDSWSILSDSLDAVRNRQPASHGFSELYTMVETLCNHKLGGQLYTRLYHNLEFHLFTLLTKHWTHTSAYSSSDFLLAFSKLWNDFSEEMKATRLIFTVLDRNPKFMQSSPTPAPPPATTTTALLLESKSIWDLALQLFRIELERQKLCLERLIADLLLTIAQERRQCGKEKEGANKFQLLRMFYNLKMHTAFVEPRFLAETEAFYTNEGQGFESFTVSDYLIHVETRLHEESMRAMDYFDVSLKTKVDTILYATLFSSQAQTLVNKGLTEFLTDNRMDDLARLYRLCNFSSFSQQREEMAMENTLLVQEFTHFCKTQGEEITKPQSPQEEMISRLIAFKHKVNAICQEAFHNDANFTRAVQQSFEVFLNDKNDNKPAELLAKFVDATLRSSTVVNQEESLNASMELFRFLHAKDVFEQFYKLAFSKRLLLNTSNNPDLEHAMLAKLKSECGASFTNKLEGMIRDVDLSARVTQEFHLQQLEEESALSQVHVLSAGFWPHFEDSQAVLPSMLDAERKKFEAFYTGKHQGRVLKWVNVLAHCTVKFTLNATKKWDLEVSLFQALVLLYFNTKSQCTFREIQHATLISQEELLRTLASLALGKKEQRVLVRKIKHKTENDEDVIIHPEDVFEVNASWSSKRSKVKINQVQLKETKKETEEVHKQVGVDRQYQIDATIVRIMKARKRLTHALLLVEVVKQLPFNAPPPQDVKKRIETLIEREYLERDEEDPNTYLYMV